MILMMGDASGYELFLGGLQMVGLLALLHEAVAVIREYAGRKVGRITVWVSCLSMAFCVVHGIGVLLIAGAFEIDTLPAVAQGYALGAPPLLAMAALVVALGYLRRKILRDDFDHA